MSPTSVRADCQLTTKPNVGLFELDFSGGSLKRLRVAATASDSNQEECVKKIAALLRDEVRGLRRLASPFSSTRADGRVIILSVMPTLAMRDHISSFLEEKGLVVAIDS